MFLGISNVGWVLYAVLYAPLVIGLTITVSVLVRSTSNSKLAGLIALVLLGTPLLLYPVLEAQYSQWQMRQSCSGATGLVIHDRVVVEGYFNETDQGYYLPPETNRHLLELLTKDGYRFREFYNVYQKKYIRIERAGDRLRQIELERPTARYMLKKSTRSIIGLHLIKNEQHIIDTATGKAIASDTMVYRTPSFADRLWLRFFGPFESIEGCPRDHTRSLGSLAIRSEILIPIDHKK